MASPGVVRSESRWCDSFREANAAATVSAIYSVEAIVWAALTLTYLVLLSATFLALRFTPKKKVATAKLVGTSGDKRAERRAPLASRGRQEHGTQARIHARSHVSRSSLVSLSLSLFLLPFPSPRPCPCPSLRCR